MSTIVKFMLLWFSYLTNHNRNSKIIYYHDLGRDYSNMGTEFNLFKTHINIIKNRDFSLVDSISQEIGEIMVCFDDGLRGIYDYRNYFVQEGFFPTIFLAVDLIGRKNYLNKEEILEMQRMGFHFQCHTWTHTGLPTHQGKDLEHELKDAKHFLQVLLDEEIDSICFPQGMFSDEVIEKCREYGFKKLYSTISGRFNELEKDGLICRILLQDTPASWLKYILEGDSAIIRGHLKNIHCMK